MTWQKFEYFLNAVLYCLWLKQNKSQEFMQNAVSALLSWISRHLFSSAYSAKFDDYKAANLKIWDEYRNNPNGGWDFIIAHNLFDFLFASRTVIICSCSHSHKILWWFQPHCSYCIYTSCYVGFYTCRQSYFQKRPLSEILSYIREKRQRVA